MKKYCVGMDVFQTVYVEVEAEAPEEAQENAVQKLLHMNQGDFNLHFDPFECEETEDENEVQ